MEGKKPSESAVESRYLLMPNDANQYGTAFGGVIVAWIDMIAAMAAQRHCGRQVVTAGIDSLSFKEAVRVGEHVVMKAVVNYVGKTSMEVGVEVYRDDPYNNRQTLATTAYLTFVAISEFKEPVPVRPLLPETPEEKMRYEQAKLRVQARKKMIQQTKQHEK